jgi:hypothetical protein
MDPFHVLESRAQNAVGLIADKGPHVLTQGPVGHRGGLCCIDAPGQRGIIWLMH